MYSAGRLIANNSFSMKVPPVNFGEYKHTLVPVNIQNNPADLDISFELSQDILNPNDALESQIADKFDNKLRVYDITTRSEMLADSENRVERIHGTDPSELPRVRATCILNAPDYRNIWNGLEKLGHQMISSNYGRVMINSHAIFNDITGGGHTMGTTRMGFDKQKSVVDKNCRVH